MSQTTTEAAARWQLEAARLQESLDALLASPLPPSFSVRLAEALRARDARNGAEDPFGDPWT